MPSHIFLDDHAWGMGVCTLPYALVTRIKFAHKLFCSFRFFLISFTIVQKESSFVVFRMGITALLTTFFSFFQPYAKRARHEFPLEEEYRSALQAVAGALETTESLLQKAPAPAWLLMEMEVLQERIDKLKRCIL